MDDDQTQVNKGFINFSAYIETFPIVIDTLDLLLESENKEKSKDYIFLFKETKEVAINILTLLAKGYNMYKSEEKAKCYGLARDSLSHTQSNLLILENFNLIPQNQSQKIILSFESKIRLFNAVIRKMEKPSFAKK